MFFLSYKELLLHQPSPAGERQSLAIPRRAAQRWLRIYRFTRWYYGYWILMTPVVGVLNYLGRTVGGRAVTVGYGVIANIDWRTVFSAWIAAGLLKNIQLDLPFADEPRLYHFSFHLHPPHSQTDGNVVDHTFCRGRDKNYDLAMVKAVGEVVERYPFSIYQDSDLLVAPPAALSAQPYPFLDVTAVHCLRNPSSQALSDQPLFWTQMQKVVDCTTVTEYVPAAFRYWNFAQEKHQQPVFIERSTHGTASYTCVAGALNRALYEWIGRDGFYHHWGLGIAPEQVCIESCKADDVLAAAILEAEQLGYKVHVLHTTSPVVAIPSFTCVLVDTKEHSLCRVAVGESCTHDWREAILAALEEAWGCHQWVVTYFANQKPYAAVSPSEWGDYERLSFFAQEGFAPGHFFLSGPVVSATALAQKLTIDVTLSEKDRLHHTLCACRDAGLVVYYDVSNDSVNGTHFNHLGLHAARVYVKGLLPPWQQMRNIPVQALQQRAKDLGATICRHPHPYL